MKLTKWTLAAVGAVAVGALIIVGALGVGISQAQQPGEGRQAYEEALASRLGISIETLREAQQQALDQVLQDAVASGRLTQERADKIKEHPGKARGALMKRGAERLRAAFTDIFAVAAGVMKMTPDELRSELKAGKSVAQLTSERGVPLSDVEAAITAEVTEKVNEAVQNGSLTREQGDRILAGLSERLDNLLQQSGGKLRKN